MGSANDWLLFSLTFSNDIRQSPIILDMRLGKYVLRKFEIDYGVTITRSFTDINLEVVSIRRAFCKYIFVYNTADDEKISIYKSISGIVHGPGYETTRAKATRV